MGFTHACFFICFSRICSSSQLPKSFNPTLAPSLFTPTFAIAFTVSALALFWGVCVLVGEAIFSQFPFVSCWKMCNGEIGKAG